MEKRTCSISAHTYYFLLRPPQTFFHDTRQCIGGKLELKTCPWLSKSYDERRTTFTFIRCNNHPCRNLADAATSSAASSTSNDSSSSHDHRHSHCHPPANSRVKLMRSACTRCVNCLLNKRVPSVDVKVSRE